MSTQTPKVFKTSIVPDNSWLYPVRNQEMIASSLFIEVFHVMCFAATFAFIFAGIWKAAVTIDNKEKEKADQASTFGLKAN